MRITFGPARDGHYRQLVYILHRVVEDVRIKRVGLACGAHEVSPYLNNIIYSASPAQ